jgi:predicted small lipoprotein YifL
MLWRTLAAIAAIAAVLALTGCGRKGPLDPPPTAVVGETSAQQPSLLNPVVSPIGSAGTKDNPGVGENGLPLTPKGEKKPFLLDPLLN